MLNTIGFPKAWKSKEQKELLCQCGEGVDKEFHSLWFVIGDSAISIFIKIHRRHSEWEDNIGHVSYISCIVVLYLLEHVFSTLYFNVSNDEKAEST